MEDYCSMAVLFLESELNSYKTFIDKSVDLNKRKIFMCGFFAQVL